MSNKKLLYTQTFGTGPDLVFLHGLAWTQAVWQPLLSHLQTKYRITLVDLPGFGRSHSAYIDFELATIFEQLFAVVPQRATWVGWSLGGIIATEIALQHPERVEGLILTANTPRYLVDSNWPGISDETFAEFYRLITSDFRKHARHFIALQCDQDMSLRKRWRELQSIVLKHDPDPAVLEHSLIFLKRADLRDRLHAVQCPTLYILGEYDRMVPVQIASSLKQHLSAATIKIMPGVSHLPFLSNPSLFCNLLTQFIQEYSSWHK